MLLWTVKSPHPLLRIPALSCVRSLLPRQSGATFFSCALHVGVHIKPHRNRRRCWVIVNSPVGKDVLYFPPHLKLKTKTETKNEIFKVINSVLCFLLPFSPQYLHGRYSIPSPDPAQLPRLRVPVSTAPPNLPAVPRTPLLLHSTVPGTPAAHLAIPTVCVASWSRRIPVSRPHGRTVVTHQYPSLELSQLNRLRAVLATPVSAWLFGSFLRCTPGPRFPGYFPRRLAADTTRVQLKTEKPVWNSGLNRFSFLLILYIRYISESGYVVPSISVFSQSLFPIFIIEPGNQLYFH